MSGPSNATMKVPAIKWWLAISRGRFAKDYTRGGRRPRPAVACDRTPSFDSPISRIV
jgi:hypothetical protein